MARNYSKNEIALLAHDLAGTAGTIEDAASLLGIDEANMTNEDSLALDALVFECECCGWWHEMSELGDDNLMLICIECDAG